MDNAGSLIVDILTANRDLSGIAGASAILDSSNYTIQALSFGKGSEAYSKHAHSPDVSAQAIASAAMVVWGLDGNDVSSYQTSDADLKVISYPNPIDTRLEPLSTKVPIMDAWSIIDPDDLPTDYNPEIIDVGQNLNALNSSGNNGYGLSSLNIGCYASSGGTTFIKLDGSGYDTLTTSSFISKYNLEGNMDVSGFINMVVSSASAGTEVDSAAYRTAAGAYGGLIVRAEPNFSSTGEVTYQTWVSGGDLGAASLYGGIHSMGLWYLDLKTLLAEGKMPPYSFDALNNQRKYKLFCKKVYSRDITHHADSEGLSPTVGGLASFCQVAPGGFNATYRDILNTLTISWTIEL